LYSPINNGSAFGVCDVFDKSKNINIAGKNFSIEIGKI
jgi:hypothetical protein